ncbi:hypothetical protein [Marinobacter caseinilyticus]|uniref:hypothetical protein n=1 Tax=Marinobacter caseinilyticus TaxID=2692195 RepID=UPI00140A6FEC|nr:hypothetical protein [Marinobacter caseinilyticus]
MSNQKTLSATINAHPEQLHLMSQKQFHELVKRLQEISGNADAKSIASLISPVQDVLLARRLINEIGLTGRAVAKNVGGDVYIVIKGYPGLRQHLTSTRYLDTHPKVVDLAIGRKNVNRNLISGARLTIYLTVPISVLQHLLNEKTTLTQLIGQTTTDLVKLGLATLIGSAAAFVAGTVTTIAAGPLVAAIAVGVATGYTLDHLDRRFGVTEALIKGLDAAHDSTFGELARQILRFERGLIDEAIRNMVGSGMHY